MQSLKCNFSYYYNLLFYFEFNLIKYAKRDPNALFDQLSRMKIIYIKLFIATLLSNAEVVCGCV